MYFCLFSFWFFLCSFLNLLFSSVIFSPHRLTNGYPPKNCSPSLLTFQNSISRSVDL
eukprot:UN19282